jgi:nicotinate-nucleotide pyrophosphorylase (carboxylating)
MIERLLEFLEEDLGSGDITTDALFPTKEEGRAVIATKEAGILAGAEEASVLLDHFSLEYAFQTEDGEEITGGENIALIKGDIRIIMKVERLVLNLISRMSGIATHTRELSDLIAPHSVSLMATRKTTPGFRFFEKKAVELGGALSHRHGLYDEILIKDNHLAKLGITDAVKRASEKNPGKKVEIEISSKEDALEAVQSGADILLIDNLTPNEVKEIVKWLEKKGLRNEIILEISGGISRETILDYAKTGADRISVGALTTNSKWLDMSLKITL